VRKGEGWFDTKRALRGGGTSKEGGKIWDKTRIGWGSTSLQDRRRGGEELPFFKEK